MGKAVYVKEWNGVVVVLHGRYSNAKGVAEADVAM